MRINECYQILDGEPPAKEADIDQLLGRFDSVPVDYLEFISSGTEMEISVQGTGYLRIWGPIGCIEMDEGYGLSKRITGAFPFGDNGGGSVLAWFEGLGGFGVYLVSLSNISREDATHLSSSIKGLLELGEGRIYLI